MRFYEIYRFFSHHLLSSTEWVSLYLLSDESYQLFKKNQYLRGFLVLTHWSIHPFPKDGEKSKSCWIWVNFFMCLVLGLFYRVRQFQVTSYSELEREWVGLFIFNHSLYLNQFELNAQNWLHQAPSRKCVSLTLLLAFGWKLRIFKEERAAEWTSLFLTLYTKWWDKKK